MNNAENLSPLELERRAAREALAVGREADRAGFLQALRDGYSVTYAAQTVGLSRRTVMGWREDPAFDAAFRDALASRGDFYEDRNREMAAGAEGRPPSMAAIFNGLRLNHRLQPEGINVSSGGGSISFTLTIGEARDEPEQLQAPSVGGYIVDPSPSLMPSNPEPLEISTVEGYVNTDRVGQGRGEGVEALGD